MVEISCVKFVNRLISGCGGCNMDMVYIVFQYDGWEDTKFVDRVFLMAEDAAEYCSRMSKKAPWGVLFEYESYPLC